MNSKVRSWIVLVFIALGLSLAGQGVEEQAAIDAIKAGDVKTLADYMERHPGANCAFSNGKTGLYYAIVDNQVEVAAYLLGNGADPNQVSGDQSLLKWAIRHDRERILRLLIEFGADVNETDKKKNTPLIYAASLNNMEVCKILADRGADPLHTNLRGKRASDFAYNYEDSKAYRYLKYMEQQSERGDSVASMQDGPYVFRETDNQWVMTWFEHDQEKRLTRMIEKTIWTSSKEKAVGAAGHDGKIYHLKADFSPDSCYLRTDGNVFTVGDVHGKFQALITLLYHNRVIDQDKNWIFGNGQLVMLGDVFDRGGSVTEVLWFLYELQIQAQQSGGNVHLLLGNHEMMALTRDYRYLNDKYDYFTKYFRLEYSYLFEAYTVLGSWLRSQNVVIRINDNLLLHAGISPEFAALNIPLKEINERIREYLNSDYAIVPGSLEDSILGAYGPQWYRGYGYHGSTTPEVTQGFVDLYLASQGLKRMIIGHNEQRVIQVSFNGKVISADVALDDVGTTAQALLIEGDKLYRCNADGTQEPLPAPSP